jgi:hypothetical protein
MAMQFLSATHQAGRGWRPALDAALDSADTLVLAFGAPALSSEQTAALLALRATLPQARVLGCSTAGEISAGQVSDDSLSVLVVRFEHTRLWPALTPVAGPADSRAAGQRIAQALANAPVLEPLRALLVLSDGLQVNGTALVQGLMAALPHGVEVSGGLAGDGSRFGQTWIFDGEQSRSGHVCAVGLYGTRLHVGHGCGAGWSDFGPERRITRAEGNVLYELDDQPALALYKRYLGERSAELPGSALRFPLAVRRVADDEALIRTVLAVDEASQSMTFAGDIPEGGIARLMRTSNDRLIESAGEAASKAMQRMPEGVPLLALSVSCVGRRLVLGERTEEEVETVLDTLSAGSAQVGFYSYGEISPPLPQGSSELHNQTMTVTVLAEA